MAALLRSAMAVVFRDLVLYTVNCSIAMAAKIPIIAITIISSISVNPFSLTFPDHDVILMPPEALFFLKDQIYRPGLLHKINN